MSEEKTIKTSAEIVIGGQKKTIQKLKAGKFYDAQKIIAEMFKEAAQLSTSTKLIEGGKTPDIKDMDLGVLVGLFEKFPAQVAKFVAVCAEIPEEEILKEAYPEEITEAFGICLELNNVMENLKNSVAPIGKLGAQGKA
jgi:hypothetical protein